MTTGFPGSVCCLTMPTGKRPYCLVLKAPRKRKREPYVVYLNGETVEATRKAVSDAYWQIRFHHEVGTRGGRILAQARLIRPFMKVRPQDFGVTIVLRNGPQDRYIEDPVERWKMVFDQFEAMLCAGESST